MKDGNKLLISLLIAGMELSYLYSGMNFVTTVVFQRTFPFAEAVGSFLLAALLTALARGRGWRVITVAAVQAIGFLPVLWRMVTIYNSWSDSFESQTWFTASLDQPSSAVDYFVILLVIAWVLVFWAGGAGLSTSDKDYYSICRRFDRGLLAFFALFLIRFYLNATQATRVEDPVSGWMVVPFILFSLLAIGVVRNADAAQRDFLPGFQRIGALVGFSLVVLVVGTGLVFFFLPVLTLAAEQGSGVLSFLSAPFVSMLYRILSWLFGDELVISDELPAQKEQLPTSTDAWTGPWWLEPVARALTILVVAILVLILLAMLGLILYSIVVWLFSRTAVEEERPSPRQIFLETLAQLRALLASIGQGMLRQFRGYSGIIQLYAALQGWGRISGAPPAASETPAEYGLRLERRFPTLKKEIETLVQTFNHHVYGQIALSGEQMANARSAWHRLASLRQFPLRIKSWFQHSPHLQESTIEKLKIDPM